MHRAPPVPPTLVDLVIGIPVTLFHHPFARQIFSFRSNRHRVSRDANILSLPSPWFCYCCSRNARILLVSARQWSVLAVIAGLRVNGWPGYGRTRTASGDSSAERVIQTCTYKSSSESWDAPSAGGIWLYRSSLGATAMARRTLAGCALPWPSACERNIWRAVASLNGFAKIGGARRSSCPPARAWSTAPPAAHGVSNAGCTITVKPVAAGAGRVACPR